MHPPRHALGALLLARSAAADCPPEQADEHVREAEKVFRADLRLHPKNIWGLKGLVQALTRNSSCACELKDEPTASELDDLEKQLEKAQEYADVDVGSACACAPDGIR